MRKNSAAENDARDWDKTKDQMKSNISQLKVDLSNLEMAAAKNPNVTTDTIIKAQQAVSQMQSQTAQRRDSVNNIWFGSGAMSQKVRFVEVRNDSLVDHGDGKRTTIKLDRIGSFIEGLQNIRSQEYPLFIVHPKGLELWKTLEDKVESAGIAYGFEPFTKVWAPILGSGQK